MSKKRPAVSVPHGDRITSLRAEMQRRRLDGYLVQNRMDQFWLTGFTGEDGLVLVTPRAVVLLTDGRFDEAADREAPYAKKVLRKQRTAEVNARELRKYKLGRLGFAPGHMNVADFQALRKLLAPTRLVPADGLILPLRQSKDAGEVAAIRRAIDVAQRAFERVRAWLQPGRTEREIAARLDYEMQMLGAQGASFPTIVAIGANASLPHYEPGDTRFDGQTPLLIDWGARVGWYCSDLTRVIWPAKPPPRLAEIHKVVQAAQRAAIAAVRPGMTAHELDQVARDVIVKAGYGDRFNHALGHGLGLDVHEAPRVGQKTRMTLKTGMVITIEPGIYLPGVGGVRIEDDVLVTDSGGEVLTALPVDEP